MPTLNTTDLVEVTKHLRLGDSGWQEISEEYNEHTDILPGDIIQFTHFFWNSEDGPEKVGLNFQYEDTARSDGPEFYMEEVKRFCEDGTFKIVEE